MDSYANNDSHRTTVPCEGGPARTGNLADLCAPSLEGVPEQYANDLAKQPWVQKFAQDKLAGRPLPPALTNLGALPQGASPAAEEYESVSDLVDALIAELNARDIIYIANVDQLEDQFLVPLGHMLAWRAAPEFGAASDQALAALATQAELNLKEMDNKEVRYLHTRTMRTDYPTICRSTT